MGVPVDEVTERQVLEFVALAIEAGNPSHIVTVNAEFVMQAQRNIEFREAINLADIRTADGVGVVLALRRRGTSLRRKVGGSDLIWSLSAQAARLGHRLFLLGGSPGIASRAALRLVSTYPGLQIAGTHSGSPDPGDDEAQIKMIREAAPDILLVAFGSPNQDLWIARHRDALGVPISIGMGGSFDYVAGAAKRAPVWMQQYGLDWLWRLVHEPWRWRRMMVLPVFAWHAIILGE